MDYFEVAILNGVKTVKPLQSILQPYILGNTHRDEAVTWQLNVHTINFLRFYILTILIGISVHFSYLNMIQNLTNSDLKPYICDFLAILDIFGMMVAKMPPECTHICNI